LKTGKKPKEPRAEKKTGKEDEDATYSKAPSAFNDTQDNVSDVKSTESNDWSNSEKTSTYSEKTNQNIGSHDGIIEDYKGIGEASVTPEQFYQQTYDSQLRRGLRILVPVDLQAYVVESQSKSDFKPATKSLVDPIGRKGQDEQSPATPSAQPVGIHLHWSMPDALMVGEEIEGLEPTPEAGLSETHAFPNLPDRWVVVRQWRTSGNNTSWESKSWVIESNIRTVTELDEWISSGPSQSEMTAIDDGDPTTEEDITWTATYDGASHRFTFHDIPETGITGPLNYLVAGWYSTPSQDPLNSDSTTTRGEWKQILESLGWSVPEQDILDAVDEEEKQIATIIQQYGPNNKSYGGNS